MKYLLWIWRFWRPHRKWLIVLGFLTLLSSAVAIGYPLVFKYLVDTLVGTLTESNPELALSTAFKLVGIIAVIGLARSLTYLYPGTRAMINSKLEMDIRQHYFSKIIEKGYRFFQKFRTGDLVTRLTDDIGGWPKIAWFSCSGIFRAVESTSKFIFCIAVMLVLNWKLALLSIAPLPLMLYIFYRLRIAIGQRAAERQKMISRTNEALEAAFSGIRILKAFRAEKNQSAEFAKLLDERIRVELNVVKLWMGVTNVYWAIQFAGQIIVITAGGAMVIRGTLSLGELYAFYVYLSILLQPLMDIPNLFVTAKQAFASIDREMEIDETEGGTEDIYVGRKELGRVESVKLIGVSFKYEEGLPFALKEVDFEVSRGEKVAVVGTVGSGKSTLLKVIAGILPPQSGQILVNGIPLTELNIRQYRQRVGYIPQQASLFSETVAENVRFGREISDERIIESLQLAQIRDEVEEMPAGIMQVLGQRGLTVSGGQKQRLAIARALAGNPDLILMDDCTASLDAENEQKFWYEFNLKFPEVACVIVTHRLSTARQADTIYVMAEGRIVAKGSHNMLVKTCKEYRNLLIMEEIESLTSAVRTAPTR